MADYCLEILINPSNHVIPDAAKNARRWEAWDIVDIYPADKKGTRTVDTYTPHVAVGMPRTGYLFVTDAPEYDLAFIKGILADINMDENDGTLLGRRRFKCDGLSGALQTELDTNRYTTVAFTDLADIVWNKKAGRKLNPVTDIV